MGKDKSVIIALRNLVSYFEKNNIWKRTEFISKYSTDIVSENAHRRVWQTLIEKEELLYSNTTLFEEGNSEYIAFILSVANNPEVYFKEEKKKIKEFVDSIPF